MGHPLMNLVNTNLPQKYGDPKSENLWDCSKMLSLNLHEFGPFRHKFCYSNLLFWVFLSYIHGQNKYVIHFSFGTKKMINRKVRQISIWALNYTNLFESKLVIIITIQNMGVRM